MAGGNLEVVGDLQVIAEQDGLVRRDVAISLEVHQAIGVALGESSADELCQDVEWNGDSGDTVRM